MMNNLKKAVAGVLVLVGSSVTMADGGEDRFEKVQRASE